MNPGVGDDTLGGLNDAVRLQLGGDRLLFATEWDVHESILSQPAQWSVTIGTNESPASFLKKYPPRTPFKLFVGGALQLIGETEGYEVSIDGSGTVVIVHGRDALAPLHRSTIRADESYTDATYAGLVRAMLKGAGLDDKLLVITDADLANRQLKAGHAIHGLIPPRTIDEIIADPDNRGSVLGISAIQPSELHAKAGMNRLMFLRKHLDRAGLFLWASADGHFLLSASDTKQKPLYRIIARRAALGQSVNRTQTNVLKTRHVTDTTHRHSDVIVYGKGGGRKKGRAKSLGTVDDAEMIALGYTGCSLVIHDDACETPLMAACLAHRHLAEERRHGWRLEYTIAGHTLPAFGGGTAVVTTNTVAQIDDADLGLSGLFYLEGVERRTAPDSTSVIHFMRLGDAIFGSTSA